MIARTAVVAIAAGLFTFAAHAQTLYWSGTTGTSSPTWSTLDAWSTAAGSFTAPTAIPGASNGVVFNITPLVDPQTVYLDGNQSALGLTFSSAGATTLLGGNAGTAATNTLTLGRNGITVDAAAGAVTVGSVGAPVTATLSGSTNQTWTNNSATVATLASPLQRSAGSTLGLAGSGTFATTGGSNTNGILGPWATIGTGTNTRYVTVAAGDALAAYTGATAAATGANVTATDGTVNYDVAANGTFTNGASFNTLRYTGTSAASTMGGSTRGYTLNGILNSSTAALTMTGTLTMGSTRELVVAVPSGTVTISGRIGDNVGGASSLVKTGTGTLTLSSALNTYTGPTIINAGTLSLTGSLATASTISIASGATLNVGSSGLTVANAITGAGSVTLDVQTGAFTLSGNNSYSGGTTLVRSFSTVNIQSLTALGTGPVISNLSNATWRFGVSGTFANDWSASASRSFDSNGNSVTLSGRVTGGVSVLGSGTFTLTGTAQGAGTSIAGIGTRLVLRDAGTITGTNGVVGTNNGISLTGTNNVFEYASSVDVTAGISGGVGSSVVFTGPGAWTLGSTAMGIHPGGITLAGGRINLNDRFSTASVSNVLTITGGTIGNTSAAGLSNDYNNNQSWNGNFAFAGPQAYSLGTGTVTLGGNRTVTVTSSTLAVGGPIVDGGNDYGLTVSAAGAVLQLNGTNTFTGNTLVSSGTLMLGSNLALQTSGLDTSGGGVLATSGATITSPTLGGLIGSTNLASEFVTAAYGRISSLTLNPQAGKSYSYSGVIANGTSAGMTVTKSGPGTQRLSGSNTFSGKTTIAAGTLEVATIGNSGTASPLGQNTTVDFGSGTTSGILRYTGAGETTSRVFNLPDSTGGGGIVSDGSGPLVFSSGFTASGSGLRVFTLGGTSSGTNQLVSIAGTGVSVNKTGPGTWKLTGASSYSGRLTVLDGTVVVAANESGVNSPFGSNSGTTALIGNSAADASGTAALLVDGVTVKRGITVATLNPGSSQVVVLGGSGTFGPGIDVSLGRSVTLQPSTGATLTFIQNTFVDSSSGSAGITVGSPGNAGTVVFEYMSLPNFAGIDITTGTAQLITGVIGVNVINPATPVRLASSATLVVGGNSSISQQLGSLAFTGNSGLVKSGDAASTLRLWSGSTASVTATGTNNDITAALALDVASSFNVNPGGRLRITSAISGSSGASLTKNGAGTLELTGMSDYPGATSVAGGSLLVNGRLTDSAVTVSGGLLGGSGTISGFVRVLAGGTFSPGNSPGLITTGTLDLAGTTLMEIDGLLSRGGVGGYDGVNVTGPLTYGGSMLIDFADSLTSPYPIGTEFNLFDFGSQSGSFSSITTTSGSSWYSGLTFTPSGGTWTAEKEGQRLEFTQSTGNLVIVPEPAAIAIAGIGIAAAAWAIRRRRS